MDPKPHKAPHFFKIILSDTIQSGKLRLPKKFARVYGGDLSDLVHLKVPGCTIWPVELERWDGVILLSKGWPKFVDHYSIDSGHLLVFGYEGNSVFHVIICDKSTLEIEYPTTSIALEPVEPKMEETDCDTSVKIPDTSSSGRKMRSKSLKSRLSLASPRPDPGSEDCNDSCLTLWELRSKNSVHGRLQNGAVKCSSQGDGGRIKEPKFRASPASQVSLNHSRCRHPPAPEKARKLEWKSKHPSFHVLLHARHFKRCYPHVPKKFLQENIRKSPEVVTMKFQGRSWPVKLFKYTSSGRLSAGWCAFARGTSLSEGDTCVFELIDRCKTTFEVSIFRHTSSE